MQQDCEAAVWGTFWSSLYPDLKTLAKSRLRRSGNLTLLDTTGLVHEAYLRVGDAGAMRAGAPRSFLAYAARTMRSVVIDLIRERQAEKRGGDVQHVTLDTAALNRAAPAEQEALWIDDPLRVDEALRRLADVEPRLSQVVEMRYFGAFTEVEIGEALGVTARTVRRDLTKANLLLRSMLNA